MDPPSLADSYPLLTLLERLHHDVPHMERSCTITPGAKAKDTTVVEGEGGQMPQVKIIVHRLSP
jgi:hypothetical protein